MSNFKRAPVPGSKTRSNTVMTSDNETQVLKSILPAEILSTILDYLPIPDLMRFARTSKRMQEMVYDDTRWVQRLRSMGIWNEAEARARFGDSMKKKWLAQKAKQGDAAKNAGTGIARRTSTTLFDASVEEEKQSRLLENGTKVKTSIDGFETLNISSPISASQTHLPASLLRDPASVLTIFTKTRSIRGSARHEFGRIYGALAPFYNDLTVSQSHNDPVIFQVYRDPEQQAQMLAQLLKFSQSDWTPGWKQREDKLNAMIGIFENAVLREFEQGYEAWDIDGRMRRYANVLDTLNGSMAGIEVFLQKHPLFADRNRLGNPIDCINHALAGSISLEPSRTFLEALSKSINDVAVTIGRVFPPTHDVLLLFIERVAEDIIGEYVTTLFDEAHERSILSYLKAVSGVFEQSRQFSGTLKPIRGSPAEFKTKVNEVLAKVFEPHLDLYLQDELDQFKRDAEAEVTSWEVKLDAEDASTESFFMANVNRQADKKDFLSSFKKVIMMPVNVLPNIPLSSPFAMNRTSASISTTNGSSYLAPNSLQAPMPSRPHSPAPPVIGQVGQRSPSPGNPEGPTNELTAKAGIMASRMAGIKSLFSIEVALNLVHAAKTSLERTEPFVHLGGQIGEEAREQCEMIFVVLLQILGLRHVKNGFDKAVEHLSTYNPREVSQHGQEGVAPLVTFLELVNVGDLISQMIDVFYEQQLASKKLVDKNDFLDPAVKAKKKFEQVLDERVAAGLNKGIDVLMDEVEYVCATTQLTSDYNPAPTVPGKRQDIDIGPTNAATQVVDIVSSHTKMLTGSTDKNMLDVFNQEVGLRLFTALCKHLKRQRISTDGAIKLISDMNLYFGYVQTLRNQDLLQYFKALRELSQIYLIDPSHAKEMATIVADGDRFYGIFRAEEVYEFAERRADWFQVKGKVERAMYGLECSVM